MGWLKYFEHNTVVSVSTRMEEGLLMVPLPFINELIWSCLAMAKEKYPVDLISFVFEPNHLHLTLRVLDPQDVSLFLGYFKQEISHRLNRLLNKRKKTNWCKGFSSPTVLDKDKVLHEIAYGLTNPVKDNLDTSLDRYPGVSSWGMLRDKRMQRSCRYTSRDKIPVLRDPSRPWRENRQVLEFIKRHNKERLTLELSPYAWKQCFKETKGLSDEQVHELMMQRVREVEKKHQEKLLKDKTPLPRPGGLMRQSMLKAYTPKKYGKKMVCLSSFKVLRVAFIERLRALCVRAREVYERWKMGDFSVPFPPGLYAPSPPRLAECVPKKW